MSLTNKHLVRSYDAGFIGMALSYGLSLNMSFVQSIQKQCMLVNYIISVERLNQYMHVPSEAPEVIEGNRPPLEWPDVGKVELQDLKVNSYFLCVQVSNFFFNCRASHIGPRFIIQTIFILRNVISNRSDIGPILHLFFVESVAHSKEDIRLG